MSDETTTANDDFAERLASIERGVEQMADVGGVWPRDVRWLLAALRRARRDTALADAARRWVKAQALFRTANQDDRDYAAKSAELIRAEHAFYDAVAPVLPGRDADHE